MTAKQKRFLQKVARCDAKQWYVWYGAYFRDGAKGYTDNKWEAGLFSKEEAISHYQTRVGTEIIPVDAMLHNLMILDKIKELTAYIIK